MKQQLLIILSFFLSISVYAQTARPDITGNVSFISSENVYVRFSNTDGMQAGDTLFISKNKIS